MDFYKIKEIEVFDQKSKVNVLTIYPDFKICRSKDLMIRGKDFYAVWDEVVGLWSVDEYDVQRLVDQDLYGYYEEVKSRFDGAIKVKYLGNFSSGSWLKFQQYIKSLSDTYFQLDERLTFDNEEVSKSDYVSRRLPYSLNDGSYAAYDELVSTLYDPPERDKLEWAIGSVLCGDSRSIQKFAVLYGSAGSGKSTALNIIQSLFEGYTTTFDAKSLGGSNNSFATEAFRSNPLVAIQQDGDLSRIEDNTKLNSIVSHEDMLMNEKYKAGYTSRVNAFLFMGTNKPVKITDAKSGIIRRLIDIRPSGRRVTPQRYQVLTSQIRFELGSIATHCLDVYRGMGKDYYADYRPVEMMLQTDVFFNFIEAYYDVFSTCEGVTLQQAYKMYKVWGEESLIAHLLPQYKFRDELRNYFLHFEDRTVIDGVRVRSWYTGFIDDSFRTTSPTEEPNSLVLDSEESLVDHILTNCPAQYANEQETPSRKWASVETTLKDLDTSRLHYVKPPSNHIVIDFDLKDADGNKDPERNLAAASEFPPTYAEFSKGGGGVHLHYIWEGDPEELSRLYSEGIEVKVFTGDSSLRRRLSLCNNIPVATISTGLPKKENKVITVDEVKSEKALRDLITRNLRKEIHPATKPSVDFIKKILDDAYSSSLVYDLEDMRGRVISFANSSSNQALTCIQTVMKMKFKSEEGKTVEEQKSTTPAEAPIVFYDIEVFPNLFILNWKYADGTKNVVRMINPKPEELERLLKFRLVGFNNRKYDNHILYAAMMGYSNHQLYMLSQKIITERTGFFGEAYNLSYTDIYDFSSKKQGLKKWEIELGLIHKELGLPWDEPVDESLWIKVAEYCDNDVISTEAVFNHLKADFAARQILSTLSGLSVNQTTNAHTTAIIFGSNRKPQSQFVYTDLATGARYHGSDKPQWQDNGKGEPFEYDHVAFPGYEYKLGKSSYRGDDPSEGGYVYAEPGMYEDVALIDVASMHPSSIENLEMFGPYTKKFSDIKQARVHIKRKEYDDVRKMFDGALAKYLESDDDATALSTALKIAINSVYGLTAAHFDNPFRDIRNVDNIVAKRGALFMIDLRHFVQERGFTVVHIKTDSIKIANATPEIIEEVMEFGQQYGYEFEHEATYEKLCLVNNAVYVAKTKPGRKPSYWTATGAQFIHPVVFKTLFSKEPVTFEDYCETKTVTTALYLDYHPEDPEMTEPPVFIGRVGSFVPVTPEGHGGRLLRKKDDDYHNATGAKGYLWRTSETVKELGLEKMIEHKYYRNLIDEALDNLSKFGDAERFVS